MVLTHPWTRLDLYLGWRVGTENIWCCSRQNLENSDDGSVGTLAVLGADWSVITKYGGVFELININELRLSVTATVGRPLICLAGTDRLFTSDINPSVNCHKDFHVSKRSARIQIPHVQTVLTNILKLLLWATRCDSLLTVSCKATRYVYFSLLTI